MPMRPFSLGLKRREDLPLRNSVLTMTKREGIFHMRSIFLTMTLAALSFAPVSGHAQSLTQAMEAAYANNPSLIAARSNLAVSDETIASARSDLLPDISADASNTQTQLFDPYIDSDSWSVSVSVTQLIYNGGRALLAFDAALLGLLADREDLIDTEQDILLDAITAYMDVRRDTDVVRLSQNNVRVLQEQLRAANERFEVGEVTRTDVAQTEARVASARATLVNAQGTLDSSRESYRAVIGSYPTSLQTPGGLPQLPSTRSQAEAIALVEHPRMLSSQFDLAAAEVNLDAAKRALRPTITGTVSIQRSKSATSNIDTDSASISLNGSVPIYQGGGLNSDIRSATASVNSAKASLQLSARLTQQAVLSAYATWRASVSSIDASTEAVRAARIAFDGVSEEAALGARTTLDVLDAEQELLDAQTDLATARRDEVVARFTVLSEMGRLTAERMALNVVLFDPEENYNAVNPPSKLGTRRDALLSKIMERTGN